MRKITEAQVAYVAGFYEGEGTFCIVEDSNHKHRHPTISAGQENIEPLVYILKVMGLGRITSGHSPKYRHSVSGRQSMMDFIKMIYPYLRSRRTKKRAWCVYHFAKLLNEHGRNNGVTGKNLESRNGIYKTWKTTVRPRRIKGKVK